jgi:hypothetical protein
MTAKPVLSRQPVMKTAFPWATAVGLSTCLLAHRAHAFEGQWHLGAGAGMMAFSGDSHYVMPELTLHGAYGISDTFDARLELGESIPLSSGSHARSLGYAEAALVYKLDVVEWIPWAGIGAGVFGATGGLQGAGRNPMQPAASLWLGLDYAFNREWGLGGAVSVHSFIADSARSSLRYAATSIGVHVERRFGW